MPVETLLKVVPRRVLRVDLPTHRIPIGAPASRRRRGRKLRVIQLERLDWHRIRRERPPKARGRSRRSGVLRWQSGQLYREALRADLDLRCPQGVIHRCLGLAEPGIELSGLAEAPSRDHETSDPAVQPFALRSKVRGAGAQNVEHDIGQSRHPDRKSDAGQNEPDARRDPLDSVEPLEESR